MVEAAAVRDLSELPSIKNMPFQNCTTSCTIVFHVLFMLELSELDQELIEESELHHKERDFLLTEKFHHKMLLRRLTKFVVFFFYVQLQCL